jgi:hypothetical protein
MLPEVMPAGVVAIRAGDGHDTARNTWILERAPGSS